MSTFNTAAPIVNGQFGHERKRLLRRSREVTFNTLQAVGTAGAAPQGHRARLLASSALNSGMLRALALAVSVCGTTGLALSPQQAAAQYFCDLNNNAGSAGATATGINALACGTFANAIGTFATATGAGTYANGSAATATGSYANANGDNATATGVGANATGGNATATGNTPWPTVLMPRRRGTFPRRTV